MVSWQKRVAWLCNSVCCHTTQETHYNSICLHIVSLTRFFGLTCLEIRTQFHYLLLLLLRLCASLLTAAAEPNKICSPLSICFFGCGDGNLSFDLPTNNVGGGETHFHRWSLDRHPPVYVSIDANAGTGDENEPCGRNESSDRLLPLTARGRGRRPFL